MGFRPNLEGANSEHQLILSTLESDARPAWVSLESQDTSSAHGGSAVSSNKRSPWGSISNATGGRNTVAVYTRRQQLHEHEFARDRSRQQSISIHGWIYELDNGLLRDLGICVTRPEAESQHFDAAVKKLGL